MTSLVFEPLGPGFRGKRPPYTVDCTTDPSKTVVLVFFVLGLALLSLLLNAVCFFFFFFFFFFFVCFFVAFFFFFFFCLLCCIMVVVLDPV